MKKELKIGVAGLGTVGTGVVKIIQKNSDILKKRSNADIKITAVSARDKSKNRDINLSSVTWYDDATKLAMDKDVDVVVEAIGGDSGVAYELAKLSLQNGKHYVTANKALIAVHGTELAGIAEKNDVSLLFEAAVAGGIPIIKGLREGLAANNISRISGIMNGTCNYILTSMKETGKDFKVILKEAQKLGYAEADPSFDVDGIDTAHKLAILSAIGFGANPDFKGIFIEGIRNITLEDIQYADEMGYKIKLLGICERTEKGVEQRVHPSLVKKTHPLAKVDGVNNAVYVEGDFVGKVLFEGPGAGEGPTGSSVVSDIVDIASGRKSYPFGVKTSLLDNSGRSDIKTHEGRYLVRINVVDRAGVMASISDIFLHYDISMESILQKPSDDDKSNVICITHKVREENITKALDAISKLESVINKSVIIRVL